MSTLQWALLLLGAGIALLLLLSSRRERRALDRSINGSLKARGGVGQDWTPGLAAQAGGQTGLDFDELGVSKPRPRSTGSGQGRTPELSAAAPPAEKATAPAKTPAAPGLLIALYIAEHEGTNIFGPKIHAALKAQNLRFGAKKIYHRAIGERPVFSVASLVKPGTLDPAEAAEFSTPGLSVFMQLPGPDRPEAALQDLLTTARALARGLNAELFDTEQRQPLTAERESVLQARVRDWARLHQTG